MAEDCTRREFLVRIAAAHAATALGCNRAGKQDWLARERVCIHVLNPRGPLPQPLLDDPGTPPQRDDRAYFGFGLPELALCTTAKTFLQMFQYFWPVTPYEIAHLRQEMEIEFQRATIAGGEDVEALFRFLQTRGSQGQRRSGSSAVLVTYNDHTRFWFPAVIRVARNPGVDELVLFKDPTRPPYLCEYPSSQKGFKKPPP